MTLLHQHQRQWGLLLKVLRQVSPRRSRKLTTTTTTITIPFGATNSGRRHSVVLPLQPHHYQLQLQGQGQVQTHQQRHRYKYLYRTFSSNRPDIKGSDLPHNFLYSSTTPSLPKRKTGKKKKDPKRTALYEFHNDIGCTWTTVGEYTVPLYYHHSEGGIIKEHNWARTPGNASIFDISFLTQYRIFGKDRFHFMERCTTADLLNLPRDQSVFTCLTDEVPVQVPLDTNAFHATGDNDTAETATNDSADNLNTITSTETIRTPTVNIIDTGMISNCDDNLYMVVNGEPHIKSRLWKHLQLYMNIAAKMNTNPDRYDTTININKNEFEYEIYLYMLEKSHGLLSIQGSGAADMIQPFLPSEFKLNELSFHCGIATSICDVESTRITRTGYSGMDGFEISLPRTAMEEVVVTLLEANPTALNVAGMGARDTLRCESGFLQYGMDIDPYDNSMLECGYHWTISERRRTKGDFLGADHILGQLCTTSAAAQPVPEQDIDIPSSLSSKKDEREEEDDDDEESLLEQTPARLQSLAPLYPYRKVGIIGMDRIVTANTIIYDGSTGTIPIGHVTSGVYSPTLQQFIALGYVLQEYASPTTAIQFQMSYCNGRKAKCMKAQITTLPFLPTQYYRYIPPPPPIVEVEKETELLDPEKQKDDEFDEKKLIGMINDIRKARRQPQYSSIGAKPSREQIERYNPNETAMNILHDMYRNGDDYNDDDDDDEFFKYSYDNNDGSDQDVTVDEETDDSDNRK
jgi:glycine cleavage system aminomethyltransferase T